MPSRIAQLVLRMIRPNPAKRPTIEEILSHPEVAAAVARRQPLYRELRRQSIKEHLASFWRGMWLAIMLWATMLLAWVRGVLFGRPPHSMAPREVTHDVDSSDDDHLINSPTARLIDFSHAAPPTSTDSLSSRLGLKPGAAATRSSCSRVRDIRSIGNANGKNLMKDFDSAAN
jgi:serine/threonine protein kinase